MIMRSLVVIPAFNEGDTVSNIVKACAQYCDVLVVNDGSTDNTFRASTEAGAVVITNETNKGYEYCLNVGYGYALDMNYDLMITMDADGQLPAKSIPEFVYAIKNGACLAVGRREKISRLCEKVLSYFSSRFSAILDPFCGMKAYKLRALQRTTFSDYNSIGTSLAFEYVEKNLKCENTDRWPVVDKLNTLEEVKIAVQVNGKTRDIISIKKDMSEKETHKLIIGESKAKKYIENKKINKTIFVKNKIINYII